MFDLKNLYEENGIYLWTDFQGNINIPGFWNNDGQKESQLPTHIRKLYKKCLYNNVTPAQCIATVDGTSGILLLFDYSIQKIGKQYGLYLNSADDASTNPVANDSFRWLQDIASVMEAEEFIQDKKGVLVVGNMTGNNAHEFGVFVPAEYCDNLMEFGTDFLHSFENEERNSVTIVTESGARMRVRKSVLDGGWRIAGMK